MNAPVLKSFIRVPPRMTRSLFLHEAADVFVHELAVVHADEGGLVLVQDPLSDIMVAKGSPVASRSCWRSRSRPARGQKHAWQDARTLGTAEHVTDGLGGGVHLAGIADRSGVRLRLTDHGHVRQVGGEGHVDRPTVVERRGDQTLRLGCGVLGGHDGARANHRPRQLFEKVELTIAKVWCTTEW